MAGRPPGPGPAKARVPTQKKSQATQNLDFMQKGCKLTKVRSKSKKYKRFFQLEPDCLSFGYNDSRKVDWWRNLTSSGKDMSRVYISDVKEVRDGPRSDVFVKAKLSVPEEHCFSVAVGERYQTLDLVAPNKEIKDAWVSGMKNLIKRLGEADLASKQEFWMKEMFQMADKNNDNSLNLKEIVGLLQHLNIEVDLETAKSVFEDELERIRQADADKTKNKFGEDTLDIDEFIQFYRIITGREEVEDLFESYNYEGKYLDTDELGEFLSLEEQQTLTEEDIARLIDELEPCPLVKSQQMMSIDGFNSMFCSPMMDIFQPAHRLIYQDMTQPLSDYFIDSSHNTYLTADQLVGKSAVEAYIRAMKRGCRCVELDCWDGDKGDPVIYHGYTLTSKILFKDVIGAVQSYAFETSKYPMILSLENHCSVEQQKLMAKYMKEILGDKLLTKPLDDSYTSLPSPKELMGKIVIKAKKLSEKHAVEEEENEEDGYVSDEDEAAEIEVEENEQETEEVKEKLSVRKKKKKQEKHRLAKELSDLVIICQSVSFKGFEHAKNNYNFKNMSSYGESKASGLAEQSMKEWVHHNRVQLSRTYPAGRRTDSSNYDPMPMWLSGAQIVALNYQTPDDNMHIYKGKFLDNGGCGYILKPSFMRTADSRFSGVGPYDARLKKHLGIRVISGYQLPKKKGDKQKSILDPYVKVDVLGVPEDRKSEKTEYVRNNGFHPLWDETFNFEVNMPDLALVYIRVMDYGSMSRNELVAQFCLPFNSLQPGYRTVHLKSKNGEPIWGAQLLLQITIK